MRSGTGVDVGAGPGAVDAAGAGVDSGAGEGAGTPVLAPQATVRRSSAVVIADKTKLICISHPLLVTVG